ncbi:MAG TPA: adenylosuccinate lyase family protein, partial [Desulfobacteraceae bacterium]|nr:adenylosuccinate lyase family protein [Desulfobacteraceae bacterium]
SDRLGLEAPLTCWHTSRDRSSDMLSSMAILAGTLGKIANEICQLARDEIGELEEPFHMGKIGSTTMPHKRNPELCEQVVVLAKLVKHNAAIGFETLISEHERDYRSIRLEWAAITDSCQYMCGSLSLMKTILRKLLVHEERIRENVNQAAGLIATEALMFRLGEKIGKQTAHQLLYEISMGARSIGRRSTDRPLVELLAEHPEIRSIFTREALEKAIDPEQHIGLAGELTDRVVARAADWLAAQRDTHDLLSPCPLEESGICT